MWPNPQTCWFVKIRWRLHGEEGEDHGDCEVWKLDRLPQVTEKIEGVMVVLSIAEVSRYNMVN